MKLATSAGETRVSRASRGMLVSTSSGSDVRAVENRAGLTMVQSSPLASMSLSCRSLSS